MVLYDQHTHTYFSGDSSEEPENYIKRGLELGLSGVTFTDHMDYDYPYEPAGIFEFDVDKAFAEFDSLKEKYRGSFDIGKGIEIGLRTEAGKCEEMRERLNRLIGEREYDAVIGSVHMLDNIDLFYADYWKDKDPRACVENYFKAVLFAVGYYDCFDIFGHLDYIIRYAPCEKSFYVPSDYRDITDEILKKLIERGKALEVNTKSLKPDYGLNAPNPGPEVIKRYIELGGELLTLGSDAHFKEALAYRFDTGEEILKSCGVKYIAVYRNRKPVMMKL
jgi:histidinol-phosphatase (PHP family)